MIDLLVQDYPVTMVCDILGMAWSSHFYHAAEGPEEASLKEANQETAAACAAYSYRRLAEKLKRNVWAVNHKRVQRLMRLTDIQSKYKRRNKRTTDSRHGAPRYPNPVLGMEIVRPDQVWVCDITYIRWHQGFDHLAVIMNVFTRGVRGSHLGRGLDHTLTLTALQRALANHPPLGVHPSDHGNQYGAKAYA